MKTISQNNVATKTRTSTKEPKLFVSFSSLMSRLASKKVKWVDVDRGLFYFGCTREHVMEPGAGGEYMETVITENPDILKRLQKAVRKAENEGRVSWRKRQEYNNYAQLNELLVGNGFKPLADADDNEQCGDSSHYNYPAVKRCSTELEVVF